MCSPFIISSLGMYPSPNLPVMFLMDLHSGKNLTFYLLQPPNWSMHPLYKAIREACGGSLYIGCWTSKGLGLQER